MKSSGPPQPPHAATGGGAAPGAGREPATLIREGGSPAVYLEAANRAFEPTTTDEARAWAALQSRRRLPAGVRLGWLALSAAACAVALVAGLPWLKARLRGGAGGGEPTVAQQQRAAPAAPSSRVPGPAAVVAPQIEPLAPAPVAEGAGAGDRPGAGPGLAPDPLGASEAPEAPDVAPAPLRPGRATVAAAGVSARLSARGVARMFRGTAGAAPRIALERGKLDIDGSRAARAPAPAGGAAAPASQAQPQRVAVSAAAYVFQGDGGRYSVSLDRGKVDLEVKGGRVLVWSSRKLVARVLAGERWSGAGQVRASAAMEAVGPAEAPAAVGGEAPAAPAAGGGDCLQLARGGRPDDAVSCFEVQAARPGLTGELALVEIARIRRDVQGDLAGAERALAEHRRRFPAGALASEAATSRVELLLRLGRAADALAEASRLGGGEAAYFRGLALAKLGRRDEARRALDDYLARPDAPHRAEATKRRDELGP